MNSQELYNQGREKGKRGLYQDAILNYTQAIDLNPELAEAYVSRGTVRYLVEDKQSGIEDLYKAMDIYKSRGDVARYNIVLGMIEHINRETHMNKSN